MISLYFGLPGAGKTTMLAMLAYKFCSKGVRVYGNIPIAIAGYVQIDNECVGKYDLSNSVILLDEGTIFADSRDFKNRSSDAINKLVFFLLHRHYKCDIYIYTQQWDGLDKRIRVITDRVYYVYKGNFLGRWITRYYRVPYGIIIPDPKKSASEKLGEIVQGYCKPRLLVRLLQGWVWRPRWYRYFDSWDAPPLPPLPEKYKPYGN